jgi:Xaa-Pro aminopeptidase
MRAKSNTRNRNILLYADSESDANVLYATGFFCPDPFIFVRTARGRRIYVMSDLEIDRARSQSNAHRVLALAKYSKLAQSRFGHEPRPADVIAIVLRDLKIRGVTVPGNFPVAVADQLREHHVKVSVVRDMFFTERLYKTDDEVRAIRRTMKAAESGLQAGIDMIRRSSIRNGWVYYRNKRLTAEHLREVVNGTIFDHGCVPAHTIVAPGKHGCDPHDPGRGPVPAHSPLIFDIFPRSESTGYYADITRTVVKGKAPEEVQRMYRAVKAGQALALRKLRHGAKARRIHQAVQELFVSRGFETGRMKGRMQGFFHGTGHGLGLDIHEPPRIALNDQVLENRMVVTVEPGLYYWPIGGMRIEDTVLITRSGYKNLTRFSKALEIK